MTFEFYQRHVAGSDGCGARGSAVMEGREARKRGEPRKSPYEGVEMLKHFHVPWLSGWDSMDWIISREPKP